MAWKNEAKADAETVTEAQAAPSAAAAAPAETPAAEPFVEPAVVTLQRTAAQIEWMRKHPDYAPMAHGAVRFIMRGTLLADGSFLPEEQHPPMDGGGAMSVGVPLMTRRR